MNAAAYIRDNLAGAWQVMLGRPQGLGRLDTSLEGFWRSFGAFVLIVPLMLVVDRGLNSLVSEETAPVERFDWESLFIQLVDWIAFPIVFAFVATRIGLAARYVPFVTARNWGAVIIAAIFAATTLPGWFYPLSVTAAAIISFVNLGIGLRFSYLLAKTTLGVGPSVAVPVVALELLLSLVIGFGMVAVLEGFP